MQDIFFSKLLHSEIQSHIFHLQIQHYAAHTALGDFYSSISDLNDELIEQCQGTHGYIYNNYQLEPIMNLNENTKVTPANVSVIVNYLEELMAFIIEHKMEIFTEDLSHLLNVIDEIVSLIAKTIYKLKFLK